MSKFLLTIFLAAACSHFSVKERMIPVPLTDGTAYKIREQNRSLIIEVPFGTRVTSIDDGEVVKLHTPDEGGGCNKEKFFGKGQYVQILHKDGTLAQYLHITPLVRDGDLVTKGQVIAVTANNGVVCVPNLFFTLFSDKTLSRKIQVKP